VVFVDRDPVQTSARGALTKIYLGNVTFELVKSHLDHTGAGGSAAAKSVP
jgi:hypothetical protein